MDKCSPYSTLLNSLVDMQHSPAYAVRKPVLAQAESTIVSLSERLLEAEIELTSLRGFPLDRVSDDDLWHIAQIVTELTGGSLFNVSSAECVLRIRAGFVDPDTARDMLKDLDQ